MLQLLIVVIIAGLFADTEQRMAEPTEGPETTEEDTRMMSAQRGRLTSSFQDEPECWTDWFDRDNPSGTGDWETLFSLRKKNPGKICDKPTDIEVKTLTGLSISDTGDVIYISDTTAGFVCRNIDQPNNKQCSDYRVRFSCYPPFCGGKVCWTPWYNRDNPSGSGDWELLSSLRQQYPGQICAKPLDIEVVTVDTLTPAGSTGENFFLNNPTQGFVCRNSDQKDGSCQNYKVRFGCLCN